MAGHEEPCSGKDKKYAGEFNGNTSSQWEKKTKLCDYSSLISCLYRPVDSASLGVVRALFGLMMVLDIPHERGLHQVVDKYGDPMNCHFPLFHSWAPLPYEYMGLIYLIMWIGSVGMCLGLLYKASCLMFVIPYWYIFLLDKTTWNNHSYLYGLISTLLIFTSSHYSFSLDATLNKKLSGKPVPVWNYWIIRFQFFLLYFYAGLKKMDPDWIGGHSMVTLSTHWVFDPFRILLTDEQIDLWIIHIFGFVFDLTVGFWLLLDKTRPAAILFAVSFHVMNSRMFSIGQFPYVCLVTTPIFCSYSWPKQLRQCWSGKPGLETLEPLSEVANEKLLSTKDGKVMLKEKIVASFLAVYVVVQLFLPYSHGLTLGYNNWTNGLYGYSWDMMVHSWDTTLVTITVQDHDTGKQHFLRPDAWVRNSRYTKHADMVVQYAYCIKRNLASIAQEHKLNELYNISVYVDVWCSLNNRFQQRLFDPHQDMLTAAWHPLKKTPWVLPLLTELTPWRGYIAQMRSQVLQWSNHSDAMFVADFPSYEMEHYVRDELENVTLNVLQGAVTVTRGSSKRTFVRGESLQVDAGCFHKVKTVSNEPSCFAYTYINTTSAMDDVQAEENLPATRYEIFNGIDVRFRDFQRSLSALGTCLYKVASNYGIF